MTDDLLARATRALREETTPSSEREGKETRARLERSLRTPRSTSRSNARWLTWPLAAALLVLTAWAGASGQLGRLVKLATHEDVQEREPERTLPSAAPAVEPPPAPSPSTVLLPPLFSSPQRRSHRGHHCLSGE